MMESKGSMTMIMMLLQRMTLSLVIILFVASSSCQGFLSRSDSLQQQHQSRPRNPSFLAKNNHVMVSPDNNQRIPTRRMNLHLLHFNKSPLQEKEDATTTTTTTTTASKTSTPKQQKAQQPQQQPRRQEHSLFQVPSLDAIFIDALAILLAVELIGLLADVTDVNFIQKGGWLQPLPTLEEQASAVTKVLVGWLLNVALWTATLTIAPAIIGAADGMKRNVNNAWTTRFVPSLLVFALFRCLYAVAITSVTGVDVNSTMGLEYALQDIYIVGLLLGTARYVLGIE